ncbi:protein ALP1-like [Lolium rigidum]|uniref:protein ALP1-like n=1 Tax=Lolium rigidum TaxID=89674 RepID=UPI001F5C2122|nr:protein ALP1-like [Lolium rigidum]
MAPLRGAKRRKRQPEKALPAGVTAPMPPPDAADWWDSFSRRLAAGHYSKESQNFESVFRMSRRTFDYICALISGDFSRKTQGFRNFRFGDKTILGLEDQVAVALLRLTTGESLLSIGNRFGMNHSAISNITWKFIESLEDRAINHLKWPDPEEMATIKAKFEKLQGLPNCCGAIDTTHILMCSSAQPNSNVWLDGENRNSMVLQAIVDPDMRFRDIVSGWPGSLDDSCILRTSGFYKVCEKGTRLEGQMELPGDGEGAGSVVREYIIGDTSYPLLPWLMTPYQGRDLSPAKAEFNRRHSAARMVVHGAMARLKERWQVLKGELWRPDKHRLPRIIYACCLLTNIMIDREDSERNRTSAGHNHDDGYMQQFSDVADEGAVAQRDIICQHVSRLGSKLPE